MHSEIAIELVEMWPSDAKMPKALSEERKRMGNCVAFLKRLSVIVQILLNLPPKHPKTSSHKRSKTWKLTT